MCYYYFYYLLLVYELFGFEFYLYLLSISLSLWCAKATPYPYAKFDTIYGVVYDILKLFYSVINVTLNKKDEVFNLHLYELMII